MYITYTSDICFGFTQEWSDVRLQAARKAVETKIQEGVNANLVLNVDQVWRQALRCAKRVLMKQPQRPLDSAMSMFGDDLYVFFVVLGK